MQDRGYKLPRPRLQGDWVNTGRPAPIGRSRSPHGSSGRGLGGEVRAQAEVIATPDAAYGLVEDALAGADVQGGAVGAAADEDVVDPAAKLELPVPVLGRH
jgi:hypothetical protein